MFYFFSIQCLHINISYVLHRSVFAMCVDLSKSKPCHMWSAFPKQDQDSKVVIITIRCIVVGTTGGPRVRSRLTNVHNYIGSWVYNRFNQRTGSTLAVSSHRTSLNKEAMPPAVQDALVHIALNIIGELAYALFQLPLRVVLQMIGRAMVILRWSTEISVHYLIIILINQSNKSYI